MATGRDATTGRHADKYLTEQMPRLYARMDRYFAEYGNGHVTFGREPGPNDVHMATNDYLSLAQDERIIDSQIRALQNDKSDIFMSGVYVQYLDVQRDFERKMAAYVGGGDAVLCQSGFAANEGLIQAIADPETPVYLDLYAHASLWQGALVARAPAYAFRHNNADHLRKLIARHGPGVVAVDAVYSTTGELCKLVDILEVCEQTGCLLVVDESHTVGVLGEDGAGLVKSLDLCDRVPFRIFSMSKAFVGRAGVIVAEPSFIEYFRYTSWPAIFSSAVMPWEIARFSKTLDIIQQEGWRRERLWEASAFLRDGLEDAGYNISGSETQIVSLIAGPERNTAALRDALEERGVFGAVFCAPATAKNKSLVRLCVNQGLSQDHLEHVLDVCREIRGVLDIDKWPAGRKRAVRRQAGQAGSAVPGAA